MNGTLEILLAAHTFLCDREEAEHQPRIANERTLVQTQICEARGARVAQLWREYADGIEWAGDVDYDEIRAARGLIQDKDLIRCEEELAALRGQQKALEVAIVEHLSHSGISDAAVVAAVLLEARPVGEPPRLPWRHPN
jgi:hypothetical protein